MATPPKSITALSIVATAFPDPAQLRALTQFVLDRDRVPHAEVEDALRAINRRFDRFPLKTRVLDLYTNNRIILLCNPETVKVPSLLPAWRVATDRGPTAYVNLTPYAPQAGAGAIDVRRLFGLLLFGEVLIDSLTAWPKLQASLALAKAGARVYSAMMFKIADRLLGVSADPLHTDQLRYVFAKYFTVNMLGRETSETTDAIAMALRPASSPAALAAFEGAVAEGSKLITQADLYSLNLIDFLQALSRSDRWMARLTARGFLQAFSSLYNPPALLAAEDACYFLAVLASHQAGAEIVQSYAFDPVYVPVGDDVVTEFARLASV